MSERKANDAPNDANKPQQEAGRSATSYEDYITRLNPSLNSLGVSRDVLRLVRRTWKTHERIQSLVQSTPSDAQQNGVAKRISFEEYRDTVIKRVESNVGEVPPGAINLVAKHWNGSEWSDPSGSGREGD